MFARNKSRDFLSAPKGGRLPKLEALESRAVPAVIGLTSADMAVTTPSYEIPFGFMHHSVSPVTITPDHAVSPGAAVIAPAPGDIGPAVIAPAPNADTGGSTTSFTANFALAPTDTARSATLQQFNPALGTLTSVEIIATGSTTTNVAMENLGAQAGTFESQVQADILYNVAGTVLESTPTVTKTATIPAFNQADPTQSMSNFGGPITLNGVFQDTTLTSASDLAPYIGTGTLNVTDQTSALSCSCGSGNLESMVTTQASGDVKVVYTYTPTPTPTPTPDTFPPPVTPPFNPNLPSKDLFIFYM
jgi:hypothetical protein